MMNEKPNYVVSGVVRNTKGRQCFRYESIADAMQQIRAMTRGPWAAIRLDSIDNETGKTTTHHFIRE